MILTILGVTAMTGVLGYTQKEKLTLSEGKKIARIANNAGLNLMEDGQKQTIQLLRKKKHTWGVEYCYRIPLGRSFKDYEAKKHVFEDGLNNRKSLWEFSVKDLLGIWSNLRTGKIEMKDISREISKLKGKHRRKEISLSYDGTLLVKVYNEPTKEVVEFNDDLLSECKGWNVPMGEAREGKIFHDFDKLQHMIVAGTQRYGKSVFLKNIITTLIHTQSDNVRFYLLDLKGGLAMNRFINCKQVVGVASNVEESVAMLQALERDMKSRQVEYKRKGYEDITEAGARYRDFIVVDEAAELAPDKSEDKAKKQECERILSEIARMGGGLGYRLVFATQYPVGDILPRQIKQNSVSKMCFLLDTEAASRVVLDEAGAESLPLGIKGRGIYKTDRKITVQTPFITNDFIEKKIGPHIIIKARKEHEDAKQTTGTDREDTLVIEAAGLPNNVTDRNVTPFRRPKKRT
ncbi:FtsK/SpoIIIE domain-containing protein [Paenibacillus sp. Soil724D2]|uniref:FtsK/SpoIIIE domain-containing protein n=1 Tax=Paenibacillus sp. (strain Soil724D2) TaxID=1736392 RepID=UPI0007C69E85|nr:FtsK/SpoIIIE domain-containing protein [Paenibacillus sp. Soil724D2]